MTQKEDIDALAAEYVLGTLDAGERSQVAARRQRERDLEAAIGDWERRLAPLSAAVAPLAPRDGLLTGIWTRIDKREGKPGGSAPGTPSADVVALERRVRRWRGIAAAASALAASLALFVGMREWGVRSTPQNFVAVFQKDDVSPAFLLAVDIKTRQLTIRRVAAEPQPGKTYQLWIASSQTAGKPQSLGLIDAQEYRVERALRGFDARVLQTATFGVSLEPAGGSPTGQPSPGALHAKLLPALP
jgi:anti-sigma-K factor RskA